MDSCETGRAASATAPGQWRLARIELFNWGTFDKYHVFDVSRDGLLVTGASGSGKSTIVDAISTVMAPSAKLSYNAAASSGGKRDSGRTYNNCVRGAWGHASDSSGETTRKFLRPREATWSGVLLRFEDGCDTRGMGPSEASRHEPVNLAAVFFQKRNAVSDDTVKRFYAMVRGACTLASFEQYGRNGADMAQFNKDFKSRGQAWRDQASFFSRICTVMGIRGTQTLTLLQKTQAAKNIGSLDDLFRRYMLDQPETFEQADKAVEQFEELENAHRGVVRQREQMEMLAPLDELDATYAEQQRVAQEAGELKETCGAFAEQLIVDLLEAQLEQALRRHNVLEEGVVSCEAAFARAKHGHENAAAVLNDLGGIALSTAELDVANCEKDLAGVQKTRGGLGRALANAELGELPLTLHEFEELRRSVRTCVDGERAWLEQHEDEKVRLFGEVDRARRGIESLEEELRYLRSLSSNIPRSLHGIRKDIAEHMGLRLADVPFVGELIDVKPAEAPWQGAIERLLRNRAQTMLVEQRYVPAISEYLEGRHLGVRFEYDGVPVQVEVPGKKLHERSLVRKVNVQASEGHESLTLWVNRLLRQSFDYICVDDPADMARYSHALTKGGQVKAGEHHVKDDRSRIDDRSRWVLGSSNDAKIEQLEADKASLEEQRARAASEARALDARQQRLVLLENLAEELESKSWDELDVTAVQEELRNARALLETLRQNDDFRKAQLRRDEARAEMERAEHELHDARLELDRNSDKMDELRRKGEQHRERRDDLAQTQGSPSEAQALQLRTLFKRANADYSTSAESVYQAKDGVVQVLDRRREKALGAQNAAVSRAQVIMQQYKDTFKAEGANLTASFEDREGFLARYRQIKTTGLANYEHKFLEVLTDFSQDQITVISTEIRNAFRNVRARLEPVNRSLMLSPYAPGIHLQIEVREARSARVEQFLVDLREISSGSWETDDIAAAEQRYERTAAVMHRLKSPERADREWRRECLNTPDHMKFIAKEIGEDGTVVNVHSNDAGLSGGQKQKLVFFCLAAALRYQLSDDEAQVPSFGTIVLDEAFDKSDRHFAEEALNIFKAFNFHMVLATPGKLLQTIEGHVGGVVLVTCPDGRHSRVSPIPFEDGAVQSEREDAGADASDGAGDVGGADADAAHEDAEPDAGDRADASDARADAVSGADACDADAGAAREDAGADA